MGFPGASDSKESACNVGDLGSIPWRRTWQPTPVFLPGESPWKEEPGGLQSMGLQRVWHDSATKHSAGQSKDRASKMALVVKFTSLQFSCSVTSGYKFLQYKYRQASLSITNSRGLLKLRSVESVMPFNHLIFCRPLLLPPSIFPSIRVFSNESVLHIRWPKYWSFSSVSVFPMNIQDWFT